MTMFNMFDISMLGVMLISIAVGLLRGFTREFLGVAAWVGSIVVAILLMPFLKPFITPYIKDDFIAAIVAGLIIFIITFVLLGIISRHLSIKVKSSILGGLDRTFGLVFGALRGVALLVIGFIIIALVSNPVKWPETVKKSKTIHYIEKGALYLQKVTPDRFYKAVGGRKKFEKFFAKRSMSADALMKDLSQPPAAVQKKPGEANDTTPKK